MSAIMLIVAVTFSVSFGEAVYQVKTAHPRLFIEDVQELAQRCDGPLAEDYQVIRQRADDAVRRGGIQFISNQWSIPEDLMNCAADITKGYSDAKVLEVTRQFLYLRGEREFFVVFDRVEATRPEFPRHFFLHVPTEPEQQNGFLTWQSLPEADGDKQVFSHGRSRMFLHTLLPPKAGIVLRGGRDQEAWGHPLEPTAQYNHITEGRAKPPVCPWRIEVGDPESGSRTLFLHVFEVADEGVHQPTTVEFAAPVGVNIVQRWQVRFNPKGMLGGMVNGKPLTTTIKTETQYQ